MTNDKIVWWMLMTPTKWARVDRAMVTAIRVMGDKEGKGKDKKYGICEEGGV
jgi:hypothetical protein